MMIRLPYGKRQVSLQLDEKREIKQFDFPHVAPLDELEVVEQALAQPIASPPLQELARGAENAVIIVSDSTRLVPTDKLLTPIMNRLLAGGMKREQITIVIALGMHRRQTEEEIEQLLGRKWAGKLHVRNHSPLAEDCVRLGTTSQGTPVEVFRPVHAASLRIVTGNIEPHWLVGMSGGLKALMPGVASQRAIEAHHALSRQYQVQPGEVENPLRHDLEEWQRWVPIHFLVNTVVNPERQMMAAVSGEPVAAFRQGAELARPYFFHPKPSPFDLTIASAGGAPKDANLYQLLKTLQNASQITRPGGDILLLGACTEGFGHPAFQSWVERYPAGEYMKRSPAFRLGWHKVEQLERLAAKYDLHLYSELAPGLAGLLPCEQMRDLSLLQYPWYQKAKRVAVLPHGALTFFAAEANRILKEEE